MFASRRLGTIGATALLLILGFFVFYPLASLFAGSFVSGGKLSLHAYGSTYGDVDNYEVLWTTVWLSAVRTLIAAGLAIFFAWIVTRTNTPHRGLLETLVWSAFFMPTLPLVLAWMTLALPKTGLINVAMVSLFGMTDAPFNVQSYGGIIFVSVIPWTAVLFLLLTPAFKGMDASLEEASRTSGASMLTTLRRITLPLLAPALLGVSMLGFIRMMESFEIELLLGYPARIFVFTTRVYDRVNAIPPDYDLAMALSTVFLVVALVIMVLQWRVLMRAERYTVVSGRGFAARVADIGRWKWVTFGIMLAYFAVAVVVPIIALVLGTFMKIPGLFNVPSPFTAENYSSTFADPQVLDAVKNAFLVGLVAATLGMFLYSVISYIIVRTRFVARPALEFVSWLPYAVPSLILALGFLWAFVGGIRLPFAAYGSIQLLVLVFLIRGMPLGVRVMNGGMVQLGRELEESSRVMGASWIQTFRQIVAPLMRPAFLSAWLILFAIVIRDVASVILLYGPRSRVISVLMLEYWNSWLMGRANVLGLVMVGMTIVAVALATAAGMRRAPVA